MPVNKHSLIIGQEFKLCQLWKLFKKPLIFGTQFGSFYLGIGLDNGLDF